MILMYFFNNAGYGIMGPFEKLPEQEIRKLFDTDVIGTMLVTQQFIPHFKRRKKRRNFDNDFSGRHHCSASRRRLWRGKARSGREWWSLCITNLNLFGIKLAAMIPGGTKTNFQTPINILDGYEEAAAKQRNFLLAGNTEFPDPDEAAEVIWRAVHDGKDQINYPTDSVCRELYEKYKQLDMEDFKEDFYNFLWNKKE